MIFHRLFHLDDRMRHYSSLTLTVMLLFAVLVILLIALKGPIWLKIFTVAYVFLP